MLALLHYYGVELHNFNPNSIVQAAIFAAVCEGFLGIDPHWDLWTHLFSAELFALTTGEKKVYMAVRAGGCTLQLRQGRVQQYIPAILVSSNKGWQRRWFYLRNDDRRLPSFSQRVVTAAGSNWRWGATREKQEKLQPLLEALQRLRDGGLTAAVVVAATHRRRVLPLVERRLPLSEMKPGVDLEGSQMSSASLPVDDLRRRVAGTVGRLDAGALTQPAMCPDHGYVSLVSAQSFFCLHRVAFDSYCWGFCSSSGVEVLQTLLATGPGGRGGPSRAEKKKEKKDAEKARAHERMRARAALEKRRRRQERDGLPREPSPETPNDDDDDDDDDEGDDMVARLGLSPDLRLGQGSPSQPSGLAPSASGPGTSRSRSEERRQAGGVLDPLAEVIEVTLGSQVGLLVPQEQAPASAVQEVDPRAIVTTPGQAVSSAPLAPEAGAAPEPAAGQSSAAPAGTKARGASLQARLALVRSG
jgi:hypothetical protein